MLNRALLSDNSASAAHSTYMNTAEAIKTIDSLDEMQLRNRLADLDIERSELLVLLRAKRARGRKRGGPPGTDPPPPVTAAKKKTEK